MTYLSDQQRIGFAASQSGPIGFLGLADTTVLFRGDPALQQWGASLSVEWAKRKNKPAKEFENRLDLDFKNTLAKAAARGKGKFLKRYGLPAIIRAWQTREEQKMDFETMERSKRLLNFKPPPADTVKLIPTPLVKDSDGKDAVVAPLVATFMQKLLQLYPQVKANTYYSPPHGSAGFEGRGFSIDLWLRKSPLDSRGFWQQKDAVALLRAVHQAARAVGAEWQVIYNDYSVARVINQETRVRHVVIRGLHGPAPLVLHFHLDLAPLATADASASTTTSSASPQSNYSSSASSLDVFKAVNANARYGKELSWEAHRSRIAKILGISWILAYNPISFAYAVARWQQSQGMPRDGIIGPKTWSRLQSKLGIRSAPVSRSPAATPASGEDAKFKYHSKYGGYSRYGGGRVYDVLKALRDSGRLSMNDEEIEMLQRISNVETGGAIQALNSWDDVYMSIGFMQWPVAFDKLQRLIQRAPDAFRKYGIELDLNRRYRIRRKYGDLTPIAIKGAQEPRELRSLDWAKRFYAAGLDPDIIVEEAKLALEVIQESKNKIQKKVGDGFLPYYNQSVALRALIQETYNHRPAWLYQILKNAVVKVQSIGGADTGKFMEIFRNELMKYYKAKDMTKSALNLIEKTSRKP